MKASDLVRWAPTRAELEITRLGPLVAWRRPEQAKGGGRYDHKSQRVFKDEIRWLWRAAGSPFLGYGPLGYSIHIYTAPRKELGLPDIDNQKHILDALNGMAWGDDRQFVTSQHIKADAREKDGDDGPRIVFRAWAIGAIRTE